MRDLLFKRDRFVKVATSYSAICRYSSQSEKLAYSSGVLNFIWNQWNNFWRDYWICHVSGGHNVDGSAIAPLYSKYSDKQACHFLLYKLGKKGRHSGEAIAGCCQEATWGDPNVIEKLAANLSITYPHLTYLSGILSIYKTDLAHFQLIRNTLTHLNNENVYHLQALRAYYSFATSQKILDILDSVNIRTSDRCLDNLIYSMTGMLHYL